MVFFDILLVDETSLLQQPLSSRIAMLKKAVIATPGRADFAKQEVIDFSSPNAAEKLLNTLANAFTQRWEGFVMKPLNAPRFDISSMLRGDYSHRWMKIKRQAIPGLGDMADLVVLGAGYDVSRGALPTFKGCQYTHFHVGCLKNKEDVLHHAATPRFLILDDLASQDMAKHIVKLLHDFGQFQAIQFGDPMYPADIEDLRTRSDCVKVNIVFKKPFVCEMLGFGVERPASRAHYTLRFARIVKIHSDRDHTDTMSFQELQQMATELRTAPKGESIAKEVSEWKKKLRSVDRGQKRALACWESSQRHDSDLEDTELDSKNSDRDPSASPPVNRRSPRRSQRSAPVNLIRMDTAEMALGERRMPDGVVTSRPVFQHSTTTANSESSFQTPPTSSRGHHNDGDDEQLLDRPTPAAKVSYRKRTMPKSDSEDDAKRFKKVRRIMLENASRQSSRKNQYPVEPPAIMKARPLKEATNISLAHQHHMRHNGGIRAPTTALQFIRRVQAKILNTPSSQHIMKDVPTDYEPSLSQAATPSCELTLQPSSLPQASLKAPHAAPAPSSPTSKSSQPEPAVRSSGHYELRRPNLATAHILLSPCIAGFPYVTENLLPSTATQIALPSPSTPFPAPKLSNISTTNQIILLIESARANINGPLVGALMPSVMESGRGFEIWDWRLCEVGKEGWEEAYLGRMWKDGDGVGMRFGEGKVKWVGRSRAEARLGRV